MSLFLGLLALTVATTLASGTVAVLWAQLAGRDAGGPDAAARSTEPGLDIRTW